MNDVLDQFRPHGTSGQPYPWKTSIKHYKIKPITDENYEDVLEMAKDKVLEWASYQCGLLFEKDEEMFGYGMGEGQRGFENEAMMAQLRDEKLHNMLAIEVNSTNLWSLLGLRERGKVGQLRRGGDRGWRRAGRYGLREASD